MKETSLITSYRRRKNRCILINDEILFVQGGGIWGYHHLAILYLFLYQLLFVSLVLFRH